MKNLKFVLCLFLFFLSAVHLQADLSKSQGKKKLSCLCESKCTLPCLKNEDCTLIFGVSGVFPSVRGFATDPIGNFIFTIFAPNGEKVAITTINAADLSTVTEFFLNVKPPICAGFYTISITNQNVTNSDGTPITVQPFTSTSVTNSCNQNCIMNAFPTSELDGGAGLFPIFPVGCSIQQLVEIDAPFVSFEKCKTHCECKKCDRK